MKTPGKATEPAPDVRLGFAAALGLSLGDVGTIVFGRCKRLAVVEPARRVASRVAATLCCALISSSRRPSSCIVTPVTVRLRYGVWRSPSALACAARRSPSRASWPSSCIAYGWMQPSSKGGERAAA